MLGSGWQKSHVPAIQTRASAVVGGPRVVLPRSCAADPTVALRLLDELPEYVRASFAGTLSYEAEFALRRVLEALVVSNNQMATLGLWRECLVKYSQIGAQQLLDGPLAAQAGLNETITGITLHYDRFVEAVQKLSAAAGLLDLSFTSRTVHTATKAICVDAYRTVFQRVNLTETIWNLVRAWDAKHIEGLLAECQAPPQPAAVMLESVMTTPKHSLESVDSVRRKRVRRAHAELADTPIVGQADTEAYWVGRYHSLMQLVSDMNIASRPQLGGVATNAINVLIHKFEETHRSTNLLLQSYERMLKWYKQAYVLSCVTPVINLFERGFSEALFSPHSLWMMRPAVQLCTLALDRGDALAAPARSDAPGQPVSVEFDHRVEWRRNFVLCIEVRTLFEWAALKETASWSYLVNILSRSLSSAFYECALTTWSRFVVHSTTQILRLISQERLADEQKVDILICWHDCLAAQMCVQTSFGAAKTLKESFAMAVQSETGDFFCAALTQYIVALWHAGCTDYRRVLPLFRILENKTLFHKLFEAALLTALVVHRLRDLTGPQSVIALLREECGENYVVAFGELLKQYKDSPVLADEECLEVRCFPLPAYQSRFGQLKQASSESAPVLRGLAYFPQEWNVPRPLLGLMSAYRAQYMQRNKHRLLAFDLQMSYAVVEDTRVGQPMVVTTAQYLVLNEFNSGAMRVARAQLEALFAGESVNLFKDTLVAALASLVGVIREAADGAWELCATSLAPTRLHQRMVTALVACSSASEEAQVERAELASRLLNELGLAAFVVRHLKEKKQTTLPALLAAANLHCSGHVSRAALIESLEKLHQRDLVEYLPAKDLVKYAV